MSWRTRGKGTRKQKGTRFRTSKRLSRKDCFQKQLRNITAQQLIHHDFDKDRVPNVDDTYPFDPTRSKQVEEILLSEELKEIKKFAAGFKDETRQAEQFFKKKGFETHSRIKSTNSIINKLRRKELPQLTDVGGIMILTDTEKQVRAAGKLVRKKMKILYSDNYLDKPKDLYYRALHFIVNIKGVPVEIQIKTKKVNKVAQKAHTLYKRGKLTDKIKRQFYAEVFQ